MFFKEEEKKRGDEENPNVAEHCDCKRPLSVYFSAVNLPDLEVEERAGARNRLRHNPSGGRIPEEYGLDRRLVISRERGDILPGIRDTTFGWGFLRTFPVQTVTDYGR